MKYTKNSYLIPLIFAVIGFGIFILLKIFPLGNFLSLCKWQKFNTTELSCGVNIIFPDPYPPYYCFIPSILALILIISALIILIIKIIKNLQIKSKKEK